MITLEIHTIGSDRVTKAIKQAIDDLDLSHASEYIPDVNGAGIQDGSWADHLHPDHWEALERLEIS